MKPATVLIVTGKASLCSGLSTLLGAIPCIGSIAQAGDSASAMRQAELKPVDLVLLDLEAGGFKLLAALQAFYPEVKSLLLVDDMRQQTQAQVVGADVALIKGYPAHELVETIQALLAK